MSALNDQLSNAIAEATLSPMELEVRQNPAIILLDKAKQDAFYEHVKREVESFTPDLSTETGRKAIASLAYKVARTKTAIDDAGAALKREWLEKSRIVDESRRAIRDKFDALRDQARKPLTEWEMSEQDRVADCHRRIDLYKSAAVLPFGSTAVSARTTLETIRSLEIQADKFQEFTETANACRQTAINALEAGISRLEKEEADRAELTRLRAEKELAELERLRKAAEERERIRLTEMEAAAKAAREDQVRREQEVIERAKKEAEVAALRKAEEAARKEAARIEREHQAALEAQKRERINAEQAAERKHLAELRELQKEKERIEAQARQERETIATEARRVAAEQEKIRIAAEKKAAEEKRLAANKKHRIVVINATVQAFMVNAELDAGQAERTVTAIIADKIPGVSLSFTS